MSFRYPHNIAVLADRVLGPVARQPKVRSFIANLAERDRTLEDFLRATVESIVEVATDLADLITSLPSTYVQKIGDTMTGVLSINGEGKGVIVDADGAKRFGWMKYLGYNGSIVRAWSAPLYVGHTVKSTVDDVSGGFNFIPDITFLPADAPTDVAATHVHGPLIVRSFRSNLSPTVTAIQLDDDEIFLSPGGGPVHVSGDLNVSGEIVGNLRSIYAGAEGIRFGWNEGTGNLDIYIDGIYRKSV